MSEYIQLYKDAAATQEVYPYTDADAVSGLDTLLTAKQSQHKTATVTISSSDWVEDVRQVYCLVPSVTSNNTVIITPTYSSLTVYSEAGVKCVNQLDSGLASKGYLVFSCKSIPTVDITINVLVLD